MMKHLTLCSPEILHQEDVFALTPASEVVPQNHFDHLRCGVRNDPIIIPTMNELKGRKIAGKFVWGNSPVIPEK